MQQSEENLKKLIESSTKSDLSQQEVKQHDIQNEKIKQLELENATLKGQLSQCQQTLTLFLDNLKK